MTPQDAALLASLTGFTPGPWVLGKRYYSVISSNITGLDDALTLDAYGGHLVCESAKMKANAALIAAAPDLHRIALERGAEIARLHKALDNIGELNLLPRDENGHKGWNFDPIGQEIMAARAPSKAEP